MDNDSTILITGAAGFIGYHLALRLLKEGKHVVGLDNLNPYYDVELKNNRLKNLQEYKNFQFYLIDIADSEALSELFKKYEFSIVAHLAAQAGVRYSLSAPLSYVTSNLTGFTNILECCRYQKVKKLIFASSSSVYGENKKTPFSTEDKTDFPVSFYGATKKANEVMAHTYARTFNLPCIGLRFFTVYGPWGRPDMALFLFSKAILENRPIELFNRGEMYRDFTYIDDIIDGMMCLFGNSVGQNVDSIPYQLYNLGYGAPQSLGKLVDILEKTFEKKAQKILLPMQPGDVPSTHADMQEFQKKFGFKPTTPLEQGVRQFVEWYKRYYSL